MNIYHTSDWHIGHRNILKYRSGFESIEEHDNTLIENYNSIIRKRDLVYFHGDMVFTQDGLEKIKLLKGIKILILGNHDKLKSREYLTVFNDIVGPLNKGGIWLSHHPIHPQELYNKPNIHGHTHNQMVMIKHQNGQLTQDPRYFNICPENTNYYPISAEQIKDRFRALGIYK